MACNLEINLMFHFTQTFDQHASYTLGYHSLYRLYVFTASEHLRFYSTTDNTLTGEIIS